jgi:ribosomal protein S18 acetylase RimI-like enzyme
VELRRGRAEDAAAIAEIWRLGWRDAHLGIVPPELTDSRSDESFRTRAERRAAEATVAVFDGAVAGFVMVAGDEVEQVYVAAQYRGTGVGRALVRAAERRVAEGGHTTAWLAVAAGNARARAFYERSGWRDEGAFDYEAATEDGPVAVRCHRYAKEVEAGPRP